MRFKSLQELKESLEMAGEQIPTPEELLRWWLLDHLGVCLCGMCADYVPEGEMYFPKGEEESGVCEDCWKEFVAKAGPEDHFCRLCGDCLYEEDIAAGYDSICPDCVGDDDELEELDFSEL